MTKAPYLNQLVIYHMAIQSLYTMILHSYLSWGFWLCVALVTKLLHSNVLKHSLRSQCKMQNINSQGKNC